MPRFVNMNLAWIKPYSISAACSTKSDSFGLLSNSSSAANRKTRTDVMCVDRFANIFFFLLIHNERKMSLTRFQIENHIQCLSIIWDLLVQTGQIEFILNVIFVDLQIIFHSIHGHHTFNVRCVTSRVSYSPRKRIHCREDRKTMRSKILPLSYSFFKQQINRFTSKRNFRICKWHTHKIGKSIFQFRRQSKTHAK